MGPLVRAAVIVLAVAGAGAVHLPLEAVPTKSGYLDVPSGSLFFAFYEATDPLSSSAPLLLWLQGGPGCSSLVGAFFELGPYLVSNSTGELLLRRNPFSWNRRFGVVFLDSPVGTGFSSTPSNASIPRNQSGVADDIAAALQGFVSLDESYRSRPLYVTGESYAGKYVPSAGKRILELNAALPESRRLILRGVAIGNGLTHPVVQVTTHAAAAYNIGLINGAQREKLEAMQEAAARLTAEQRWVDAVEARNAVLKWLKNATGLATMYDYTKQKPYQTAALDEFLNEKGVKKGLRAKEEVVWEECSDAVDDALHGDVMKSALPAVEAVVAKTRVLLYQGMYDIQDGVVSTEAWLKEMKWDGSAAFAAAPRTVWRLDNGDRAGYVQQSGHLSHVVVVGAGHLVPADKGEAAQAMIEHWVMEKHPFAGEEARHRSI